MAKPMDPFKILNTMAGAAHKKAQPAAEPDADDMPTPGKKSPKQIAAIKEKGKGSAPQAPKFPKPAGQ